MKNPVSIGNAAVSALYILAVVDEVMNAFAAKLAYPVNPAIDPSNLLPIDIASLVFGKVKSRYAAVAPASPQVASMVK